MGYWDWNYGIIYINKDVVAFRPEKVVVSPEDAIAMVQLDRGRD